MLAGLLATITDLCLFSLLTYVLFPRISPGYTMLATIAGRIASSAVNYFFNGKYVFHRTSRRSLFRFYTVWVGQLIASYLMLCLFGHVLGGHLTVVKIISDMLLSLAAYQLLCNWVYAPDEKGIYGPYGKLARFVFRTFSKKYRCDFVMPEEPAIFVCRHLDMHGPYTTLKWLPTELHPMIIHIYFDRKTTVQHMTQYTFAARYGKKAKRFNLAAHVMSWIAPPMMKSTQAVPVYRDGLKTMVTMKQGLCYLLKNESLIVYPDIHYMDGYDKPSDIYEGFLFIGELYYKKTGKKLSFIPLLIDDKNRRISAGQPISITNYRKDGSAAAQYLKEQINWQCVANK